MSAARPGQGCAAGLARFCCGGSDEPALKAPPRQGLARQRSAPVTPDEVLTFWFGAGPVDFRAMLWVVGKDPQHPALPAGPVIAERFGYWTRAWGADPTGGEVPAEWKNTAEGLVALVLLFNAFPRLAFAGTAEMFAYSSLAKRFAADVLARKERLPWHHELFCQLALVHSEDLASAAPAAADILRLSEELLKDKTGKESALGRSVYKCYAATVKPSLSLLRRFGRDPVRNVLLNREPTKAELAWLTTKKDLPDWARMPAQPSMLYRVLSAGRGSSGAPAAESRPRLRILALHGRTQTGAQFERSSRKAFEALGEVAELTFADSPKKGEWWDAVPDGSGAGLRYFGLGAALRRVLEVVARQGPFDGILGFSQGACLAGILAALPPEERPGLDLRFVVLISGFYCRDAERLHLHLANTPAKQDQTTVEPRAGAISVPSFHIRGTADAKVEAWRSKVLLQCFESAVEATHPGGHMAVEQWPTEAVAEWLRRFPVYARQQPAAVTQDISGDSALGRRCSALGSLPRLPAPRDAAGGVGLPACPEGWFRSRDLLTCARWQGICAQASVLDSGDLTPAQCRDFAQWARSQLGEVVQEDLFLAAWHLYPFPGLAPAHRQRDPRVKGERPWGLHEGKAFLWLFHAAWEVAPEDLRSEQLRQLSRASWADLAQLGRLAATGAARGWAADLHERHFREEVPAQLTEDLLTGIAELFAEQLREDNLLAAKVVAEVSADEALQDGAARQITRILDASTGRYPLPSGCARHAPRFGTREQRLGDLALRVATRLHELRFGVSVTDRERFRARLSLEYRGVLRQTLQCLDLHSEKRLHELQAQEKQVWSGAMLSAEAFQRLRASPLSDAILNPIPEPVEVAPATELQPLYAFLRNGDSLMPNALGDMTFDRGTLTLDRRLDLCKQVIGPAGVNGLFEALESDGRSQRHVQHLLLGNNICGDDLPRRVADYIGSGRSQLTTWYIAGNRLSGESLRPLCDALATDRQVQQLWLKRNPLKLAGAGLLAQMLRVNACLQVLDVSFCGLLDAGCAALLQALQTNRAIEHLYLDANGLSQASAASAAKLLAQPGARLRSLSLGLNRLHDEGAAALAQALPGNAALQKLCVASCGICAPGMEALAAALRQNTTLVELDVGFLKATAATGELPNRAEDDGAAALAAALRENSSLRQLKLNHNLVGLRGMEALRDMLCGTSPNTTLISLETEMRGVPREPPRVRQETAAALLRNQSRLSDDERREVDRVLHPEFLKEIASVYRLGNVYSPGPCAEDSSLEGISGKDLLQGLSSWSPEDAA